MNYVIYFTLILMCFALDSRFSAQTEQLDRIEKKIDTLEKKIDKLQSTDIIRNNG